MKKTALNQYMHWKYTGRTSHLQSETLSLQHAFLLSTEQPQNPTVPPAVSTSEYRVNTVKSANPFRISVV